MTDQHDQHADWTYKPYAGAGSPRTPEHITWVLRHLATRLARTGWTLRGGGGLGADEALALGCADAAPGMPYDPETRRRRAPAIEVYTAEDAAGLRANPADEGVYADYITLYKAARDAHPAWSRCDDAAQLRHMAGLMRLLGPYPLSAPVPVHFAVYWHDGQGETGQVIRYAERWNRGVYGVWGKDDGWKIDLRNLHTPHVLERALTHIGIDPADYRAQWALGPDYQPAGAPPNGAWPVAADGADAVTPTVFLLGHGGDPQPAFLKRLTANGITRVLDVRPNADWPDAGAPWSGGLELGGHLELHGVRYAQDAQLADAAAGEREAGARALAKDLWSHPDERVALLDRAGHPDHQDQHTALLPLLRGQGLVPVRIRRDGTTAPA